MDEQTERHLVKVADIESYNLIENDTNNVAVLSETAKWLLETTEENCDIAYTQSIACKNAILKAMRENDIATAKLGKYTVSVIVPKNTIKFDDASFILKEPDEVVAGFSSIVDTTYFDLDKFREDNPELYKKYLKTETKVVVDTGKLEKTFKQIYDKYTTEIVSTKEPTLRLQKEKEAKK